MWDKPPLAAVLAALALLGGCDLVLGLAEPRDDAGGIDPRDDGGGDDGSLDGGPPLTCFEETFEGVMLSTWDLYADGSCTGAAGLVPCSASQANGGLAIYVNTLTGYAGAARPAVDFTRAVAEVELLPPGSTQTGTNSYLQIALDSATGVRYQIEVDADLGMPLLTGVHVDGGVRVEAFSIPFDPQRHRVWQLAQVLDGGQPTITFATRASSTEPWTRLGSAPVTGSLAAVITEVGGGRYALAEGGGTQTFMFDNFRQCTASP